jgi:hypothetical protein
MKLCPNDGCNGSLRPSYQNVLTCGNCSNCFCARCVLPVHAGQCKNYEPQFFEVAQHYQYCKSCKAPLQKHSGDIHMVCQCGWEFCYVCGKKWSELHRNGHDELGEVLLDSVVPADEGANCSLKGIAKLTLLLVSFPLFLVIYLLRDLIVISGLLLVSILAGLFAFSFELMTSFELITCVNKLFCFVLVVFFPITMVMGVGVAFKEIFCQTAPEYLGAFWRDSCEKVDSFRCK